MNQPTQITIDDVIEEILLTQQRLNAENLNSWISRFPQFETELTDFAINESISDFVSLDEINDSEHNIRLERSRAIVSRIVTEKFLASESAKTSDVSEIKSLNAQAAKLGLKFPDFARRVGLSSQLALNIEQHFVVASTIPEKVAARIADVLKISMESVKSYFELTPKLLEGTNYKSATQPETQAQKDFSDLVRQDGKLTEEQKRELLEI